MASDDNVVPIGAAPRSAKDAAPPGPGAEAPAAGKGPPKKERPPIDQDHLDRLRDNFALIYGTDTVWDASNRMIMKISAMAHAHGTEYVRWWKGSKFTQRRGDPGRRWTVLPQDVVFDPTGVADEETMVNLFGGLLMEPKEGDVQPMLELARHLTSRVSEDPMECDAVLHWLLCWMAYPLRVQGAKLRTAVIMHGDEGAGKNFLFETLVSIYGEYGAIVGQDELEDKFNDWRSRKLFVVGDEVSSRQELVHNKNRLKGLITSPTVQINPKNLPRREEANHMNIAMLSNELQPQALDNTDRRYLVVFTPPALDSTFYKKLGEWRRNGGAEAWYYFLLRYPLREFDPFAPAPSTAAKRDLIDLNRKTPERFWIEWSSDEISLPYRSCSIDQAYRAYTRYAQRVGDRYPAQKTVFSRMLIRISESLKRPVRVKTMRVSDAALTRDRATRMLLVTDPAPAEGVTDSDWATECVSDFERELRKYLHGPNAGDSEESSS